MKRKLALILAVVFISLGFWQLLETPVYSQSKALTLQQVKNSLTISNDRKKESAITAKKVKQVGVTFALTPSIEADLRSIGATDELIKVIRQNSPPLAKITSTVSGKEMTNSIGMGFVKIPSGEFMMGSSDAEIDEALYECKKYYALCKREEFTAEIPKHKVTIKDGFWMGKFEITQGEWQSVMGDNPSDFKDCGANCPVERVSWDDIQIFLKRLSSRDKKFEYRLPTEAEWEYAARAGTTSAFSFGDSLNSTQANFDGNYPYASTKGKYIGKTVAVGSYQPNAFGLYDMHGNVWEWAQDIYNSSYQNLPVDGLVNLSVGGSDLRVLRGGSWDVVGSVCRSASRGGFVSALRFGNFGFRLVARGK